jgi:hypothetical protein
MSKNNSLMDMMNNQENMVENMMKSIINNNKPNNNKSNNNKPNNNKPNNNKPNNNKPNNNKPNNNKPNNNKPNNNTPNNNKPNNNKPNNNKPNNNQLGVDNKLKMNNKSNSMVEIKFIHPENDKMMTLKIDNNKSMKDLQKQLQREAHVSLKVYNMVYDNGEDDIEDMKKVGKDIKLNELHKKKFQFKIKARTFVLTEPLIKYRKSGGERVEQENPYGKFDGKFPSVAARKAARGIIDSMRLEGMNVFKIPKFQFSIKEVTRGSKNKVKHYIGWNSLTKLVTKKMDGKVIPQSIDAKIKEIKSRNNNMKINKQNNINNINKMKSNIKELQNNVNNMQNNVGNIKNNVGNIKNMLENNQ